MTIGRRSRSRSGCAESIPVTPTCGSRTNPSTVMCICLHGRHSMPACFTVCAAIVRYGDRWASGPRAAAARSGTQSPSGSVRSRPTPGKWPGIGRATWCSERARQRWQTLVDRATRYAMVVALPDGRKADAVARALIEQMGCLPVHLRRSLTWDRGLEMAHHGRSLRWGPADRLGDKFAELAAVSQSPFKKRMPPCWLRSPTQIFVAVTTAIRARRAHLARHCVQPQPSAVRLTAHGFPVLCPTFGRCRWLASESLAVVPAVPDRLARGRPRSPARSLSAADLVRREVRGGF
jgi:hypothetical protein